jgi:hypothetical protein
MKKNRLSLGEIEAETEAGLFRQIWLMSNKRSFLSGLFLRDYFNTPQFPSIFAHILPKGQNQYPHFRLYAKNIRLLTPNEHHLLDNGTEEERISYSKKVKTADWGRIRALEKELKKEYKKHFPTTVGLIIGYKHTPSEVHQKISKMNRKYFTSLLPSSGTSL